MEKMKKKTRLRYGSIKIREILFRQHPYCDICGTKHALELHHTYLIRHGFPTKIENCRLLCANCHREFHRRWDKYLDETFKQDPQADFNRIYEILKKL